MKEVIIRRSKWCRSGRSSDVALRTESGQSCCLGFVARAYGLKTPVGDANLSDLSVDQDCSVLPKGLRPVHGVDTDLHEKLVTTNDDRILKPAEREKKITALLAKVKIKAVFVD